MWKSPSRKRKNESGNPDIWYILAVCILVAMLSFSLGILVGLGTPSGSLELSPEWAAALEGTKFAGQPTKNLF